MMTWWHERAKQSPAMPVLPCIGCLLLGTAGTSFGIRAVRCSRLRGFHDLSAGATQGNSYLSEKEAAWVRGRRLSTSISCQYQSTQSANPSRDVCRVTTANCSCRELLKIWFSLAACEAWMFSEAVRKEGIPVGYEGSLRHFAYFVRWHGDTVTPLTFHFPHPNHQIIQQGHRVSFPGLAFASCARKGASCASFSVRRTFKEFRDCPLPIVALQHVNMSLTMTACLIQVLWFCQTAPVVLRADASSCRLSSCKGLSQLIAAWLRKMY